MASKIDCPECGAMLRQDEIADADGHCPECGQIIEATEDGQDSQEPSPRSSGRSRSSRTSKKRPKVRAAGGASARQRRQQSEDVSSVGRGRIVLIVIGILSLLLSGLLIFAKSGFEKRATEARRQAIEAREYVENNRQGPNGSMVESSLRRNYTEQDAVVLAENADIIEKAASASLIGFLIYFFVGATFIGLGIWASRKPSLACMIGAGIWLLGMLLGFATNPASLFSPFGWIINAIVMGLLMNAMRAGRRQEHRKRAR